MRLQQVEELTMHNAHLESVAAELAALLQVKLMRSCICSAQLRWNVYALNSSSGHSLLACTSADHCLPLCEACWYCLTLPKS